MSGKEQGVSWFVSNGDILGITFAVPTWHRLLRTRLSNCSGWRTVLCVKFDLLLRMHYLLPVVEAVSRSKMETDFVGFNMPARIRCRTKV